MLSGVGEASFMTVVPPLITTAARPGERGVWLAVFYAALPVGSALGYMYGSTVANSGLGWSWAYFLEALCMLPLASTCLLIPHKNASAVPNAHDYSLNVSGKGDGGKGMGRKKGDSGPEDVAVDVAGGGVGGGGHHDGSEGGDNTDDDKDDDDDDEGSGDGAGDGAGSTQWLVGQDNDVGYDLGYDGDNNSDDDHPQGHRPPSSAYADAGLAGVREAGKEVISGAGEWAWTVTGEGARTGARAGEWGSGDVTINGEPLQQLHHQQLQKFHLGPRAPFLPPQANPRPISPHGSNPGPNPNPNFNPIPSPRASKTWRGEVATILSSPTFCLVVLGAAACNGVSVGMGTFGTGFVLGLGLAETENTGAAIFGGLVCLAGVVGTPVGGWLIDRADEEGRLTDGTKLKVVLGQAVCLFCSATLPLVILATQTSLLWFALLLLLGGSLLFSATPHLNLAVMLAVPKQNRPLALALNAVGVHAMGDVSSPVIIGAVKDALAPACASLSSANLLRDLHLLLSWGPSAGRGGSGGSTELGLGGGGIRSLLVSWGGGK
ncbi:unnamed protein product, partial [Discosporangium mesarthrocarpum]